MNKFEKIDNFKNELIALLKKHKIRLHPCDEYDGKDEYCGTDWYFKVDEEVYYADTVEEFMEDLVKENLL